MAQLWTVPKSFFLPRLLKRKHKFSKPTPLIYKLHSENRPTPRSLLLSQGHHSHAWPPRTTHTTEALHDFSLAGCRRGQLASQFRKCHGRISLLTHHPQGGPTWGLRNAGAPLPAPLQRPRRESTSLRSRWPLQANMKGTSGRLPDWEWAWD